MNQLFVVIDGRIAGTLTRTGRRLRLTYEGGYDGVPLSVSLPTATRRHGDPGVERWVEGLFPERPELLRAWRARLGVTSLHPFDLLAATGEDVAGAAQFVRPERLQDALTRPRGLTPLTDGVVADALRQARADVPIVTASNQQGKFSLAGMQSKIALQRLDDGWALPSGAEPSTHILKPAMPGYPDQDLVELATLRLARELGLAVAEASVLDFEGERALVVERFDREPTPAGWRRVHHEDALQALGLPVALKYQSQGGPPAATIADLLRRVSTSPDADVRAFVSALVFNWRVRGTDAHARNYSLRIAPGEVRLAPLYDLNSFFGLGDASGAGLSMSIGSAFVASEVTDADWRDVAVLAKLPPRWVLDEVARQRDELPGALRRAWASEGLNTRRSEALDRMAAGLLGA